MERWFIAKKFQKLNGLRDRKKISYKKWYLERIHNKKIYIEQGYLSKSLDGWIIRIRFTGKNSKIALKKHIKGFTNFEFEYTIPRSDAKTIMSNLSNTIKKDRFFLEIEKKSWVVDCFKENNYHLKLQKLNFLMKRKIYFFHLSSQKKLLGWPITPISVSLTILFQSGEKTN